MYKKQQITDTILPISDVNVIIRKLANASKPTLKVTKDDNGQITIKTKTLIKSSSVVFKLDEEFDETRQDDVKVKSKITRTGDTLRHTMVGADKTVDILREFRPDGVHAEATVAGITCVRFYERVKSKKSK